jgi:large subunit ribosomal protein L25
MEKYILNAQPRTELGKQNLNLRNNRMIPAVVYGHGADNHNVTVSEPEFRAVFAKAEQSGLIELTIGDAKESVLVLIHDLQRDPLSQEVQHVDFYRVKQGEKLTATVSLEFIGESPAEKELGGNLVTSQDSVEIECLPKDLVQHLQVDLSKLKEFGDAIHYSDLEVSDGIEIIGEPETVIVSVQEPRKVEEETPAETPDVDSVEVEKKGKQEGEEGETKKEEAK